VTATPGTSGPQTGAGAAASVHSPLTDGDDTLVVLPDEPTAGDGRARSGRHLLLSELLVGVLLLAVSLVAWASLALADLGHQTLAGSLLLGLGALAILAAVVVLVPRLRPQIKVDRGGLVGVLLLAVFAGVFFVPGFHYGLADKDPGGYVAHAMGIARTGNYEFQDPAVGKIPDLQYISPGARFNGFWVSSAKPGWIVPQFYHLWPALMAVSYEAFGERGLAETAPLCALLAALAVALALRRAVASSVLSERRPALPLAAGLTAGALLVSNMMEVWQAKTPASEACAQMLFAGGLLALVVTISTRWRPAAGVAGLLVGISFLVRGDGLLQVLMFAALGAVLLALRRWDGRATWAAIGLLVTMPHAFWQAYSKSAAWAYTTDNSLPTAKKVIVAVVAMFVVAAIVARTGLGRWVTRLISQRRVQLGVGGAVVVLALGLLALGFLRPRLFGANYFMYHGVPTRSFDDQAMARLAWFFPHIAFGLAFLGLVVIALRRWSAALWVLAVPLLALLPVYAHHPRVATQLMWWTRRFVPTILPGLAMLAGLFIGVLLTAAWPRVVGWTRSRRAGDAAPPNLGERVGGVLQTWPARALSLVLGAAALIGITTFGASQSWPLRHHDEFGGSFALTSRIANLAPEGQGIFLFRKPTSCCWNAGAVLSGPVMFGRGQLSALMPPATKAAASANYVREFQRAFPGRPIFIVWDAPTRPDVPGVDITPVHTENVALPMWEVSSLHRPRTSVTIYERLTVYRVGPA
jgi:transposase